MAAYYKGTEGNYTIKGGENLSTIARNAGVSVADLQKWNNIPDVNKIGAGAKLYTYDKSAQQPKVNTPVVPTPTQTPENNVINVINGKKTVNENDIYNTGADKNSSIPSATDNMKKSGVEYSWDKEGRIQGFLEEQNQVQQARRDAIEQKSKIDYGKEINEAGAAEVVTAQNKNKMGITGMAAETMDRNVTVARNARALELYSSEEMIKTGYETGVKIAALYGDLKTREVTATEYQKAVDDAYNEASITGVYFDPIQMQLLNQRNMASAVINNPYATPDEKTRAKTVTQGIRNAFLELGLSDKGVDTLTKIYNSEQLELQKRANTIAATANEVQKKNIALTKSQFVADQLGKLPSDASDSDIKAILKNFGSSLTISEARAMMITPTK